MPVHRPTVAELVAITRESLAALPDLTAPECRFELRVVRHALEIVGRELESAATADAIEHAALSGMLGHDADVEQLNRELCERLERGQLAPDDRRFLDSMRACVRARLAIDNPRFEGERRDEKD